MRTIPARLDIIITSLSITKILIKLRPLSIADHNETNHCPYTPQSFPRESTEY